MASDNTGQEPQPGEPSVAKIVGIESEAPADADTEGHSMLDLELARITATERIREGERMSRDRARVREAGPSRAGGFLKRLGRR
jgi:hypothetical protein